MQSELLRQRGRDRQLRHQVRRNLICWFTAVAVTVPPKLGAGELNHTPEWAKEAVWYQIFPERFRNGDKRNDPTIADLRGSWPHEQPGEWNVSPWTADWYKLQPWEEGDTKGFYYHAQLRRYGGDLQGVLDKLDYLHDLGVNAIYFNPLFQSPSLHKYDASMYHHIDRTFGPDPAGDRSLEDKEDPGDPGTWKWTAADKLFLELIREAHKRDIRIIIDGVFHCTGSTFWAFEDVVKNQERSKYKDWYTIKRWDDPSTAANEFDYQGWYGVRELPELKEENGSLARGPAEHIHAIVKRWMDPDGDGDPSDGIDGWRLDAAEMVPAGFWSEFRGWVKGTNPDSYLVAELWWEDWEHDKMFNAEPWLQGDKFDAVMNYRWAREVVRFFVSDSVSPSEFDARLRNLRGDYPSDVNDALMNLIDSHDTDRLGSMIVNADPRYDHNVGLHDNPAYKVSKPGPDEIRTQELVALFQMTYPGAPMVYYGDEAGMWGADDPDERKPMLWPDLMYEDETHHPFGLPRPADKNEFNNDLHDCYRNLIHMRRSHIPLAIGDFSTLLVDDARNVYAFKRSCGKDHVVAAFNNSRDALDVVIPTGMEDIVWKKTMNVTDFDVEKGNLKLRILPRTAVVVEGSER